MKQHTFVLTAFHSTSRVIIRLDSSEVNGTFSEDNRILRKLINNRTVSGSLNEFTSARAVIRDSRNNNSDFDREIFLPDLVTNQAITTGRDDQPERMIVHYMQPHAPFISSALERGYLKEHEKSPYSYLKEDGDFDTIWEAYLNNLRFVLDEIGRLLDNIDADSVVITADHGELFGEWNLYSHTYGVPHLNLCSVPWVETSAVDTGWSYPKGEISQYEIIPDEEANVEDRLNALRYN
ncbi:sulfatase-like hydrolase/transferase [Haloquadratum walsbyi]|uniref:AlkP-core domain protein n=1 Tax=Haloquadratum walsbyi (strain DSM 16790 / HBSQ001) TaxID=362976 RepID=Q18EI4_HALWD|nr:sulfatase-like hydrolase/transferase [Haloquadratum walsbyi]CAJ53640.1 AlkP-core domain protein [Haloquadratum walsbyi DSM 16790]